MIWPLLIGMLIKCWWIHWCWSKVKVEVDLAVDSSLQKLSKVWTACNNCLSFWQLFLVVYAVDSLWKLSKLSTTWNCCHQQLEKAVKAVNSMTLLSMTSTTWNYCQSCQQLSTAVKAVNSFFFSELNNTRDITTQISIQTHLTEVEWSLDFSKISTIHSVFVDHFLIKCAFLVSIKLITQKLLIGVVYSRHNALSKWNTPK